MGISALTEEDTLTASLEEVTHDGRGEVVRRRDGNYVINNKYTKNTTQFC